MRVPTRSDGSKGFAKPEAAVSKDRARPSLAEVWFREGNLYATDSYIAVRIPVEDCEDDTEGSVPVEALKAARKNKLPEMQVVHLDSAAKVETLDVGTLNVPRSSADDAIFPNIDQLVPDPENPLFRRVTIKFSVKKLTQIADALGTDAVCLTIQGNVVRDAETDNDEFQVKMRAPFTIRPGAKVYHSDDRVGLLMPIV